MLGNFSKIIFSIAVIGIESTNPGIPQIIPQMESMTKTVIVLIEKLLPNIIGSKIFPIINCTPTMMIMKPTKEPVADNSTKANSARIPTKRAEPII